MFMLPTFLKGIGDVALKIKGILSVRNRVGRMKKCSENVFSPSRYTFSAVSLFGFSFSVLLCAKYHSAQNNAARWALYLVFPFSEEGVRPVATLTAAHPGAGGARCSSSVTFGAELYLPLGSWKYMLMCKKK